MQIFFVLDNDSSHHPRRLIDLALDGYTRNHVAEFHLTGPLRKDRHVVWIPLHKGVGFLHRLTVTD